MLKKFLLCSLILLLPVVAGAAAVAPTAINGAPGWYQWAAAINDTVSAPTQANILTAPFSAESTAVLAVGAMDQCSLRLQIWPAAGDTTNAVRFEIIVKALRSSTVDTLTASIWRRMPPAVVASGADSLFTNTGGLTVGQRWGSFVYNFDPKVYLPSAFRSWGPGNAATFNLWGGRTDPFGQPFMQVVVRILGPLAAGSPKVRLDVIAKKGNR